MESRMATAWRRPLAVFVLVVFALALGGIGRVSAAIGQDAHLWGVDALTKVLRDATPPSPVQAASFEGARGEVASGQIVFRAGVDAQSLRVEIGDLASGERVVPAARIRPQWVRYLDITRNSPGVPADELVARAPCAVPDPFWDTATIDVAANLAQPLWIEIDIPRDAVAGEYEGALTVRWEGGSATAPLRLTVWDFELPAARHQQVTNWFVFPGAGYQVERDSEAFWDLAAKYAKIMVDHRQTCFKAELRWIKTTFDPQRGYQCDFGFLDRWAETFFSAGMERMELFQAGAATGLVYKPTTRIVPTDLAVEVTAPDVQLTAEEKLRGVLAQFERHVREKNWTDRVMIHVQDEPFLACVPTYKEVARLVHDAAPSLKIIEAIEATGFGDAIDVLVPKLNHLNLWWPHFERMQSEGKEVWFYTCCHPVGRYPNRFLDQSLVKTRILHWMCYLYGLDGYLHWGLNSFAPGADPYSQEGVSKDLPLGDRAVMYPGRDGPVGSLRWSAMRDGLQDYELLRVLEDRLAALKRDRGEAADWLDCRQRPRELCRPVATSFYDYTRQADVLSQARRKIASEIEALDQAPLLYVQTEPPEGAVVPAGPRVINIRGIADPKARVKIDGVEVTGVGADGTFAASHFPSRPRVVIEAVLDGKVHTTARTFELVD